MEIYHNNAYKFKFCKILMKKELINGEITNIINMTARSLNRKLERLSPGAQPYYVRPGEGTDIYRDLRDCPPEDSEVMLIQCPRDDVIQLKPGKIQMHREGIKAIYYAIHSFVHLYPKTEIIAPSMLEVEIMCDLDYIEEDFRRRCGGTKVY